ncbi:MAG TPA: ATP-binding protein, partial [Nocardioides sp.]|nr:ATP-binding protein [Nocardioides sp.]
MQPPNREEHAVLDRHLPAAPALAVTASRTGSRTPRYVPGGSCIMGAMTTGAAAKGLPSALAGGLRAPARRSARLGLRLEWAAPGWQLTAIALAGLSWLLALLALALLWASDSRTEHLTYWLMDELVALVYGAAVLITLPRSRHPAVWILALSAVGCGLSSFLTQYLGAAAEHPGWWAPPQLWVASAWVWIPGTYAAMAVLPWLVSYRATPVWVRVVVGTAVAAIAWRVAATLTAHYVGLDNPLAGVPESVHALRRSVGLWPDRLCVAISVGGALRLLWLWWRARDDRDGRGRGYGWLCVGVLFMAVAFVPVVFPMPAAVAGVATDFSGASLIAAQPFLPGALLVVVLGHRLWDIDVAVDRGTLWLLLSVTLVTCYLTLGWFAQQVLSASAGTAALLGFGILLVASQPLRTWLQGRVDALVYGPASDPAALLGSVGSVAGAPVTEPSDSLDSLVTALATGLRLGRVEVRSTDGTLVAAAGRASTPDHTVPLLVHGRPRGSLAVAPPPGQLLDGRSRQLLDQLAGLIAVFVELAEVNAHLDAARSRLVEVRHEERRMLRRDLHDGIGPALAGIGLGIAAVQRQLDADPELARTLLGELKDELDRRTDDMRLLARSMLPAALDDGDLAGALRILVARFEAAGVAIEVDTHALGEVDTRRQIAVYHVAAEALVNAYRHGRARRVDIAVAGGGAGEVTLEVSDDGIGIDPAAERGVGLRSMQERADELSGRLELAGDGPGTRIRMVLP